MPRVKNGDDGPHDPTAQTDAQKQMVAEVNALGDQDADNALASVSYPPGADVLTAQNVRRYPELFTQEDIDSFIVIDEEADAATLENERLGIE